MDYLKPDVVVRQITDAGIAKSRISPSNALIRGFLAGAVLAFATSLAITAAVQTGQPLVGALVFPVGLIIIVLLGFELVTGNFALLPAAWTQREISGTAMLRNWGWVFLGNLLGSLFYAGLLWISLTGSGTIEPQAITLKIAAIAEAKTLGFEKAGAAGMLTVFVRAVLCNWMVCLGVVLPMCAKSVVGKIACAYMPIFIFFAQGYEHAVVNMFVIPAGMTFGADVSITQWWMWNQIPVTLGNLVGGAVFVGFAMVITHGAGLPRFSRNPAPSPPVPDAIAEPEA